LNRRRIYLDTSVYNRPFDDLSQPRIWLEALAFAIILQMVESGDVELVSSRVLEFENSKNPFPQRRAWVDFYLGLARDYQELDESIRERARTLESQGIKPIDALHLACAERAKVGCFITCDDTIIERYKGKGMNVMNPIDFVMEGRQ